MIINLPGDSWDYHLLTEGVRLSKDVAGMTCEIGLRAGGGSKHIIDAIAAHCPGKTHIAIDPYGHIPYEHKEGHIVQLDYTNEMRDICLENMYKYAREKKVNFQFYNMTDTEFFNRYADAIPIYNIDCFKEDMYSFIHFDGPHAVEPILKEIAFFMGDDLRRWHNPRVYTGACFCFDDVSPTDFYYDHSVIDAHLKDIGFKLITTTDRKALYQYEN